MKLVQSQTYFYGFALLMIISVSLPSVHFFPFLLLFYDGWMQDETNRNQYHFLYMFVLARRKEHNILHPLKDLLDWTKLRHLNRNRFPAIFSFLDFPTNPEISRYLTYTRLQNSPYFSVFKYARAVKQKIWNEVENRERDWGGRVRLASFARVRHIRHALQISLLIEKPTVLQSRLIPSAQIWFYY